MCNARETCNAKHCTKGVEFVDFLSGECVRMQGEIFSRLLCATLLVLDTLLVAVRTQSFVNDFRLIINIDSMQTFCLVQKFEFYFCSLFIVKKNPLDQAAFGNGGGEGQKACD